LIRLLRYVLGEHLVRLLC